MMREFINQRIEKQRQVLASLLADETALDAITAAADKMTEALRGNKKILLCGNGGSAADAQHIAAELVARFYKDRPALNAEALTVNTSSLTAIANDYDFDRIFARQVEAKGEVGDMLIGISTSGSSPNVIAAMKTAQAMDLTTIGFTGAHTDRPLDKVVDLIIAVPSVDTPRIQEAHILIGHLLCEWVERELF